MWHFLIYFDSFFRPTFQSLQISIKSLNCLDVRLFTSYNWCFGFANSRGCFCIPSEISQQKKYSTAIFAVDVPRRQTTTLIKQAFLKKLPSQT